MQHDGGGGARGGAGVHREASAALGFLRTVALARYAVAAPIPLALELGGHDSSDARHRSGDPPRLVDRVAAPDVSGQVGDTRIDRHIDVPVVVEGAGVEP